jgi:hypothetical protein
VAAALAGAVGCSLSGYFDEEPLDSCRPGVRYPVVCGMCSAGDGWELCLADGSRVPDSCTDPDDADGDRWTNADCAARRPGCDACSTPSDCNDEDATVNPGAVEACNGVDDDCDGETDETFTCARGSLAPCTTTCGSTGSGTCTAACEPAAAGDCTPPIDELCNGVDDDCDTLTDEDFHCAVGSPVSCTHTDCPWASIGTCTAECAAPAGEDCPPLEEICNDVDDDCDTTTDEGCP